VSLVQRAVLVALITLLVFGGVLFLENIHIADPDLRYPIVLLTEILGAIIMLILVVRVALIVIRLRVRLIAPHAQAGLKALGTVLIVTAFALIGCVFGVSLMINRSGAMDFWSLAVVLICGGLGSYGTSYLWRAWITYRRVSGKR
jgi:hypothetical protein